jgi:hypothetical protein
MYLSGSNARHFFSNAEDATATEANARCETIDTHTVENMLAGWNHMTWQVLIVKA